MNILFLGDIAGRPGREALQKTLPQLREKHKINWVFANGENLAHGKGITLATAQQMRNAGVDFLTSGNHIWTKNGKDTIEKEADFIIRPANYPAGAPGRGYAIVSAGGKKILIINLNGRVFFRENFDCPFRKLDEILEETKNEKPDLILLDFHAEATSEKRAMGFYADGRVSAAIGTHTHIQTSDNEILPKGTAYITDAGMVGVKHSVLGVKKEISIENFLFQMNRTMEISDEKLVEICGVILKEKSGKIVSIDRIRETVDIS
ncbi:MAG: TIGR00282 family metallophosphoesterase [bacterium]